MTHAKPRGSDSGRIPQAGLTIPPARESAHGPAFSAMVTDGLHGHPLNDTAVYTMAAVSDKCSAGNSRAVSTADQCVQIVLVVERFVTRGAVPSKSAPRSYGGGMSKAGTLRDRIIEALPSHNETPMTVGVFIKSIRPEDMEAERAIWEVVSTMERDGEIRWGRADNQHHTMQLTAKVGI